MIPRYAHPIVTELWSPEWTYAQWLRIETLTLRHQIEQEVVPKDEGEPLLLRLVARGESYIGQAAIGSIRIIEDRTQHEVVAFLEWARSWAGPRGAWLHYGLTSSDLVDTTQGLRFQALQRPFAAGLGDLINELTRWTENTTPVLGRTHGQPAEPTSIGVRATHWLATLQPAMSALMLHTTAMKTCKLSGPVGTYAHNPIGVEVAVARDLRLAECGNGASQVVPRTSLALWAGAASSFAAACAKIGTDIRLMSMLNEAREGKRRGEVGSSAMAHKHNPIVSEQLAGMARMAQGYASMLQPLDLWLERDLSSSCVERVAVPDLWHLLFHVVEQTAGLLQGLELIEPWIEKNLAESSNSAWVHKTTLDGIADGMDYDVAREFGKDAQYESYDIMEDAKWFTRQYPRIR